MKRTFLMTGLAVLTLAFFMTGCNSMKKLQKEVIETAVVGYVNPEQLESVNGVVISIIPSILLLNSLIKR